MQYLYGIKHARLPMVKMCIDRSWSADGVFWITVEYRQEDHVISGPWFHVTDKNGKCSARSQYWLARDYMDLIIRTMKRWDDNGLNSGNNSLGKFLLEEMTIGIFHQV